MPIEIIIVDQNKWVETSNPPEGGWSPSGGVGDSIPMKTIRNTANPQIVGFVPLTLSTAEECRSYDECCYNLQVFNTVKDVNSFLMELPLKSTCTIYLQEYTTSWVTIATLNNSTYGTFYNFAAAPFTLANYIGFRVSWVDVYNVFGEGKFRIQFAATVLEQNKLYNSEAFCLNTYSCKAADKTVLFTNYLKGRIGSCDNEAKVFNMYDSDWTDSIRFKGIFGYETTEYERVNIEYETGAINKIRDEAVQKFQLKTGRLPKWLHDRFKTYGLMADRLYVSDYNYSNSDYSISTKMVVADGGYAPEYKKGRLARVTVDFKEGVQNVIKSLC
jgi:hypothetical protein